MNTMYEDYAKVYRAFCDEKRLRILELLRSGEKCACKLSEDLNINQSSLSYHMKILLDSGVVEGREDGKWMRYTISQKGRQYAVDLLLSITSTDAVTEISNCCDQ